MKKAITHGSLSAKSVNTNVDVRSYEKSYSIRHSMSDLHTWTGLIVGWLLYAMFLTGTVSYFRDEITNYMRPEITASTAHPSYKVAQKVLDKVLDDVPNTTLINIALPTNRNHFATAFWRDSQLSGQSFNNAVFEGNTGQHINARDTKGGDFFYRFHFNFHYIPTLWGRWIAGLCAMFMLVAIISGIITHKKIFKDFFTFRWGKGQRSWMDAHNALSVLGIPFHFMITWSGLVTLMVLYMPLTMHALPSDTDRAEVVNEMRFFMPDTKPLGVNADLLPVRRFIKEAEQMWGKGSVGRIQVVNPGDITAKVAIVLAQERNVSTTPRYLIFNGVSGDRLVVKDSSGPAATTQGVLYGLHMGKFADTAMRWLYFLVSLAGTAMVGTGLVLWTVKREKKLIGKGKSHFGFRAVECLNITTIAGLSLAMTVYFWLNRLLPLDMDQRADWEVNGFFIVWAIALVCALVHKPKRAWVELMVIAAILQALLPVLNAVTTNRGLYVSMRNGDWLFAGFDLTVLAFSALHVYIAIRIFRHRQSFK